jgi:hypothetical protein
VDAREYADPAQEIEASLIHRNYVSFKDIEICAAHDVSGQKLNPNFESIEALHQSLQERLADAS